jgi:hypothetical protein
MGCVGACWAGALGCGLLREETGGGGCTTGAGVGVGGAVWTVGWRAVVGFGGCCKDT